MEPGLIDAYLITLRVRLRWHPDADDLVDEIADHLRERAERLVAQGCPPEQVEREALAGFGELSEVVCAFAQNDIGNLAVPTRLTRLAGLAGLGAGVAWLTGTAAAVSGGHTDVFARWSLQRYQVWVVLLMVALTLTTITLAGVLLRIGRLHTPRAAVTLAVGVLLVPAMPPLGWAVTVLTGALGLAAVAALRGDLPGADGILRPARALGIWFPGALALVLSDEVLAVGPVDDYGDHPVAWLIPYLACALCSAAALTVVGARLRSEHPAQLEAGPGNAAAA